MPIEKLTEFAKDGQKNTDELNLEVGFVVNRKPARQWFNYLFNMLSLKINELINLDPIARVEIINDLTTNDKKKPLSSAMGKKLQEEKIAISDLVNDFTTGGLDKAPTAESIKSLFSMFANQLTVSGRLTMPNPSNPALPIIMQWSLVRCSTTGPVDWVYPVAFPTGLLTCGSLGVTAQGKQFATIGNPTRLSVPINAYDLSGVRTDNNLYMFAIGF